MAGKLKKLEACLLKKRQEILNNPTKGMLSVVSFFPKEAGKPDFGMMLSVVEDLENGTLRLIIENERLLDGRKLDSLLAFCTEFMNRGPSCRYEVSRDHEKATDAKKTEETEEAIDPEVAERIREAEMAELEKDAKKVKLPKTPFTVITWCHPLVEDVHLRTVVNSDGLGGLHYDNLQLFGGHERSEYYDQELRQKLNELITARNTTTLEPVPASLITL